MAGNMPIPATSFLLVNKEINEQLITDDKEVISYFKASLSIAIITNYYFLLLLIKIVRFYWSVK